MQISNLLLGISINWRLKFGFDYGANETNVSYAFCLINWHSQHETWMNKWIAFDRLSRVRFKSNVQLFSNIWIGCVDVCVCIQLLCNVSLSENIFKSQVTMTTASNKVQTLETLRESKSTTYIDMVNFDSFTFTHLTISKMSVKYGYAFATCHSPFICHCILHLSLFFFLQYRWIWWCLKRRSYSLILLHFKWKWSAHILVIKLVYAQTPNWFIFVIRASLFSMFRLFFVCLKLFKLASAHRHVAPACVWSTLIVTMECCRQWKVVTREKKITSFE